MENMDITLNLMIGRLLIFFTILPLISQSFASTYKDRELLTSYILGISENINKNEADTLALLVFKNTANLQYKYQPVRPALFNNVLVNSGIKPRGLCWHWVEDLLPILQSEKFNSIAIIWGVSNQGSYWKEHNAILLHGMGKDAADRGVVLDPWRQSGRLYFNYIKDDTSYNWVERVQIPTPNILSPIKEFPLDDTEAEEKI